MSFDTPAGTRGARQPRAGLMMRWVNQIAACPAVTLRDHDERYRPSEHKESNPPAHA